MRSIVRLRLRLRSLFRKNRVELELDEELRAHVAREIDALVATGVPLPQARERALRAIGGVEQVKEACRDTRRVSRLEQLWQDLRYGARVLRKNPGFTAVAVLSIALGIGATTAIFSVVYAVLWRPLPFADPARLVLVRELIPALTPEPHPMTAPDTLQFAQATSFEQTATMVDIARDLSGVPSPERLRGQRVSPSLFPLLGVLPRVGRAFTTDDDNPAARVVILSAALWQRQFAGDPALVGRTILLDRERYEVVGVMPPGFAYPLRGMQAAPAADFFVPLALTPQERARAGDNFLYGFIARLRPGVTLEQANAEAGVIAQRVLATYSARFRETYGLRVFVLPLFERVVEGSERLLALLFGAVVLLLLIACANVANMLLSRATGRGRELAVRAALGASRGRLVRQLLTESVLLACAGGTLGAAFASMGTAVLLRWLPADLPRTGEVRVDAGVLLFAIALSAATGLLFGLAPALGASRDGVQASLRTAGKGTGGSAHWNWLRQGLAVIELALALVLLTGAGLLLRSFFVLLSADPGFKPEGAISLPLSLPASQYATREQAGLFYDRLLDDLATLPGVVSVGAGSELPFTRTFLRIFSWEHKAHAPETPPIVASTDVHRRYFDAVGMRRNRGRDFTAGDRADAPLAVIVNEAFARRFSPDRDVIGLRVKWGMRENKAPWVTIVGVVSDVSQEGPDREAGPQVYVPYGQADVESAVRSMTLVLRVTGDPGALLNTVRARVQAHDPHLPLEGLRTLEAAAAELLAPRRATTSLVTAFAVAALLLAGLGLYGVMAYAVGQRTQEFGIRLALGAAPAQVLGLVLRQGLALTLAGVAMGLVLAGLGARALGSLLYGVGPFDPAVLTGVPVALMVIALTACIVPARRAVRVDPMRTLRSE